MILVNWNKQGFHVSLQSFHNILRLFDGRANFPFTKSERKYDY